MTILGIDPASTATGLCMLYKDHWCVEDGAVLHTITIPKKPKLTLPELVVKVQQEIASVWAFLPDLVAIEEPFSKWPRATRLLYAILGGLCVGFGKTKVVTVVNTAWKKELTGKGRPHKEAITHALVHEGFWPADEHQASALGCALWAWNHSESEDKEE